VKAHDTQRLEQRKARIDERLGGGQEWRFRPMTEGASVRYEVADRVTATATGGIALIHELVRYLGLPEAIDRCLHIFKRHFPYFESDHVLNLAYNILAGGTCLEDIERLRSDEAYLNALGAERVPDPTTAGDFLRRFTSDLLLDLAQAINEVRPEVWRHLPPAQRRLARIDADGTLTKTTGECKEGMDVSYKSTWGYAPLIVTLANTGEILYAVNRPGNAPSHLGAAWYLDQAADEVLDGGFAKVLFRGDTDFALTKNFDRWTDEDKWFVFGIDAHPTFVARAESVEESAWKPLQRRNKGKVRTTRRRRPVNVKERVIVAREFTNLHLEEEHITELDYTPVASKKTYRMIVLRKTIRVTKGQLYLKDEVRYFFYVTNTPKDRFSTREVVFEANDRCDQERLIGELNHGVHALRTPSNGLVSNGAWLQIASLAWNLKAWLGICLPRNLKKEGSEILRMEFRRFLHSLMLLPCQVVKTARQTVVRLLTYTPWANVLIDATEHFRRQRLLA
jgi:hypothetical protein